MRISFRDFAITFLLIIFITWHPFFTHGEINLFETGLYLPGIQAILNGQIPYHDFFHLRGPLELYLPALLMHLGEPHLKFLSLYFYLGTVLTLLVCAAIICTLYRTRFFLYITVPILIAKTFPRVVFTYWGGFRYAFGLLAIFFAIRAFKSKKSSSLFWAGLFSALGFLTSIEIGFCAFMAVMAAFVFSCYLKNPYTPLNLKKNISTYLAGVLILLLPYALYLLKTDSWEPYLNSTYTVITQMQNTFAVDDQARLAATPFDILRIMLSPGDKHFKHITPLYTYVFLFIFLIWRVRTKKFIPEYIGLITLGAYGLIMYLSAFRLIEGAQFEMALQPQKIIMFFLLEEIFLTVKSKNFPKIVARILIILLAASSLGFSFDRYLKRFFVGRYFKYSVTGRSLEELLPYQNPQFQKLTLKRAEGTFVPIDQAEELEAINKFINTHTAEGETIFAYPEFGTYHFLVNRPFMGRFPMPTLSWFCEKWHQELIADLKGAPPRFIITEKILSEKWDRVYFKSADNKRRFDETMIWIQQNYILDTSTPKSHIYRRKR